METSADVIVIGGGPCGSYAAFNLAKRRIKVMVFEEHQQIGFPVHCSGHLSLKGLKNLDLLPLPGKIVENTFYGAKFYSPKRAEFTVRSAKPLTCIVNRSLFDAYLANLAKSHGAEYHMGKHVDSLIVHEKMVKGVKFKKNERQIWEFAKIIIDAEGVRSGILRQAGLTPTDSSMIIKGVHAEVENVKDIEQDFVQVFLGTTSAPGFYAWIIPKKDEKAKIGLAAKTGNPNDLLRKFMSKHPVASKILRSAKILHANFHTIPIGGFISKAFSDGFLAVGDAAAQVKPTTGGGVILGMNCAKIAAETASQALLKGDFSAGSLSAYQRRFQKRFGLDMKFMCAVRKMLNAMADDKLDHLIRTCAKIDLNEDLCDFSDLDLQGKAFLKLLPKKKVFSAFITFISLYFSAKL